MVFIIREFGLGLFVWAFCSEHPYKFSTMWFRDRNVTDK